MDAAACIDVPVATSDWPWPEPRLRYANAVLPETLLAAGTVLRDTTWRRRGLDLLGWLLDVETASVDRGGHLSPTPVAGWAMGEPRPGFDQQPIEAGAIAEACSRAWSATGDPRWRDGVLLGAAWFEGRNDLGVSLVDLHSGGCRDGLTPDGCNENQGAESTLAFLSARRWPIWWTDRHSERSPRGRECDSSGRSDAASGPQPDHPATVRPRTGAGSRRPLAGGCRRQSRAGPHRRRGDSDLSQVVRTLSARHSDVRRAFRDHADQAGSTLPLSARLSPQRRELLGAYLTQEYALEAAAVLNPTVVRHPRPERPAAGRVPVRPRAEGRRGGPHLQSRVAYRGRDGGWQPSACTTPADGWCVHASFERSR